MKNYIFKLTMILVSWLITGCEKSILDDYPFVDGQVELTHPPLDLDRVVYFIPMGGPNVQPKDHGGFFLKDPYNFPASIPVFAVADGVVIMVSGGIREVPAIEDAPQNVWGKKYEDHLIILQVSKTLFVNYAHVTTFHKDFAARISNIPTDESIIDVALEVSAGDTLGFVGPHGAMDFSMTDRNLKLDFLNPSRYPQDHIYSADVYDYFSTPIRDNMLQVGYRKVPPYGGKIDYDKPGKIIGNWFLENTSSYVQWSRQLAICYYHIFPDRITISDGSPMRDVPGIAGPGAPDVWWVKGNAPAPENMGIENGIVKYELIYPKDYRDTYTYIDSLYPTQGVMLVQALQNEKLKVEIFKGQTSASSFTTAAKIYER